MGAERSTEEVEVQRGRRDERFRQADYLLHHSSLRRVRTCGRNPIEREAPIEVCQGDDLAYYRNVQRCGSVHACPVCAPKIRHGRAGEIERAMSTHFEAGGGAFFVTLTLRHNIGQALSDLTAAVSASFSGVLRGRAYQEDKRDFGIVGTIRTLEFTHGVNGWHPHLHVLVLVKDRRKLAKRAKMLRARWSARWVGQLGHQGFDAARGVGCRVDPVVQGSEALGRYLSKVYDERAVSMELARGDLKRARGGNRSPFAILADAVADGDAADRALWREYERASKGRSQVRWSVGLRALLLPAEEVEVTDEDLASTEVGGDVVGTINVTAWRSLRLRRGARLGVLRATERHGEAGLYEAVWRWSDCEVLPAPASTTKATLNLASP